MVNTQVASKARDSTILLANWSATWMRTPPSKIEYAKSEYRGLHNAAIDALQGVELRQNTRFSAKVLSRHYLNSQDTGGRSEASKMFQLPYHLHNRSIFVSAQIKVGSVKFEDGKIVVTSSAIAAALLFMSGVTTLSVGAFHTLLHYPQLRNNAAVLLSDIREITERELDKAPKGYELKDFSCDINNSSSVVDEVKAYIRSLN